MTKAAIVIIGAGGHAKAVADALHTCGEPLLGFADRDRGKYGGSVLGMPVLGDDDFVKARSPDSVRLANGIGSIKVPDLRRDVYLRFKELGYSFVTVVHPSAVVSPSARLGEGAQIMAGAIIQPDVVIGENTIVNTGAIVDHDCKIGAHCHVAPGCTISGNVTIADACHIGTGASVKQGVSLGAGTVVGVGAAVVLDYQGAAALIGVPAKPNT